MHKQFIKNIRLYIKLVKKISKGQTGHDVEKIVNQLSHDLRNDQKIRDAAQQAMQLPTPPVPVSPDHLLEKENRILRDLNLSLRSLKDLLSQAGDAPDIGDEHPATWLAIQLESAATKLKPSLEHARNLPRRRKHAIKSKIINDNHRIAIGSAIFVADAVAYYLQLMDGDTAFESCRKGLYIAAGM